MSRRLSICYAAPGHALLDASGSARNILSLAAALGRWADVTVAFRSLREPLTPAGFDLMTIDPPGAETAAASDDVAFRGLDPRAHLSYLCTLHRFAGEWANSFDLVFEKGWRLSGVLLAAFRRHGVPGVLIENDVRHWGEPIGDLRGLIRYGLHGVTQLVSGFASRRAPRIIAETEELRTMLVEQRGIAPGSVQVVGLGVDHGLFRPLPQAAARRALGIDPDALVLLYVGGMDIYHDLTPAIRGLALARTQPLSVELHLVGDGTSRPRYQALATREQVTARFYGQIAHHRIPEFIAAADACLAPYSVAGFPGGLIALSTLKIPEYMACARPVISVPSGHILRLVQDGRTGFLFANEASAWAAFLQALPSRQQLATMGMAAAEAVAHLSWERTAAGYLEVGRAVLGTAA
jgi:glycosyltransferase involved in cell wall biosynthesis